MEQIKQCGCIKQWEYIKCLNLYTGVFTHLDIKKYIYLFEIIESTRSKADKFTVRIWSGPT